MPDKRSLRKQFREIRGSISDKQVRDEKIAERLLNWSRISSADTVLIYASIGSEIDTGSITEFLLQSGKTVALPKCRENGIMTFHVISSLSQLKKGSYNIPEPDGTSESPEITSETVCIVPGLAFTADGGRLGYGGGFYDRFTSLYPELFTVGLAYEKLITGYLPILPHDLKVNAIATEERIVLCSAK